MATWVTLHTIDERPPVKSYLYPSRTVKAVPTFDRNAGKNPYGGVYDYALSKTATLSNRLSEDSPSRRRKLDDPLPRHRHTAPLLTTGDEFRVLLDQVADRLSPYIDSLTDAKPFLKPFTTEHKVELNAYPSAGPTDNTILLDSIMRTADVGFENNSPLHMAYICSGNMAEAAVGDLMAKVLNRYVSISHHGQGLAQLEHGLIDWMVSLFGLPATAHGIFTTGGSIATISAVVGAREAYLERHGDLSKARIYVSDQTHGCVKKAVHFAGIPRKAMVVIPTMNGRLKHEDMALAIEQDVADGYTPLLIVGSAGTTNTGHIEPLEELAVLSRLHNAWFHVDACYGGFFMLTERMRTSLRGIERADSISLDPHKSLFCPSGTGVLLVRDAKQLAHDLSPDNRGPYLRDVRPVEDESWPEFADIGPELTRESRGLRMWLPLHRHGLDAFSRVLNEKIDLARYLHGSLAAMPELEMLNDQPDMSIVCARLKGDADRTDRFLMRLTRSHKVWYSSTVIDGRAALRFCILQWRTKKSHVDGVIEAVREELRLMDLEA